MDLLADLLSSGGGGASPHPHFGLDFCLALFLLFVLTPSCYDSRALFTGNPD